MTAGPITGRPELWVTRLGVVEFDRALALQHRLRDARRAGALPDVLLLLEHEPVYTRGRRSEAAELPHSEQWYAERGVALRDADRGGKTTYHGPGQLVGYPILDTSIVAGDVVRLVTAIEDALIAALAGEGVIARRDPAGRGVWAGEGKIASIGLRVAHGVTMHGFAVNVDCDLAPFSWIKPCGLDDPATSIAEQLGDHGPMGDFSRRVAFALADGLGMRQRLVSPDRLMAKLGDSTGISIPNDHLVFSS